MTLTQHIVNDSKYQVSEALSKQITAHQIHVTTYCTLMPMKPHNCRVSFPNEIL